MAVSSGQKCSCPRGEPHRNDCFYQQCLCIGRRSDEPHGKSCPRVRDIPSDDQQCTCSARLRKGYPNPNYNHHPECAAYEQSICTCAPPGMPTTQHAPPCPALAVVVKPGDKVLLCFASEDYSEAELEGVLALLRRKMLGVEWGYVTGVSGVLIQRGSDNDSDGSTDDA